jgi:hypothetical protein
LGLHPGGCVLFLESVFEFMNEETPIQIPQPNGSYLFGVSVRGWLALMLAGTVCGITATNIVMACLGMTSVNVVIPEPLYSGFMTALGFYLGQGIKK